MLAMTHLRDGEFKMTEMLLKKAEILHQVTFFAVGKKGARRVLEGC